MPWLRLPSHNMTPQKVAPQKVVQVQRVNARLHANLARQVERRIDQKADVHQIKRGPEVAQAPQGKIIARILASQVLGWMSCPEADQGAATIWQSTSRDTFLARDLRDILCIDPTRNHPSHQRRGILEPGTVVGKARSAPFSIVAMITLRNQYLGAHPKLKYVLMIILSFTTILMTQVLTSGSFVLKGG
jgi:hypothetical protein